MSEAARLALEFAKAVADATPALFELFRSLGGRDAFLASIDAALVVERARVDTAVHRKPR